MYTGYWQLQRRPFENDADAEFFYPGESHQAGLLKLRYLIENRKGGGLLVGGIGSGKTYLVSVLAQQLAETHGPFVQIVFPQMTPAEFLAYLAVELGAEEQSVAGGGVDRSLREIQGALAAAAVRQQHPVIMVDEAHLIEDGRVFQALRLLLNFQQGGGPAFTLILCGQRELLTRVQRMPQLEERLGVKCVLRSFTFEETLSYVTKRLQIAGSRRAIFEPAALELLFELSGGVPRKINRLCDLALLVGYADESQSISAEQLEAVAEELTTVSVD